MEMISMTATLVPAADLHAVGDAVSATMTRAEMEEALALEEPPELVLEVARGNGEQHALSVAWKRDDLERLLETDGSEITLMFKGDDLERAIDDDVEAHGVRNRALVLTVAVASAAVAASTAAGAGATQASEPEAKRFHGIEITAKRFHGVSPDAKRFHGVRPDGGAKWG